MTDSAVAIIDLGIGNLRSVFNSLYEIGYDPEVISNPDQLSAFERAILPGVGHFKTASEKLAVTQFDQAIRQHAVAGKPLLGICLGMQLLATRSYEGGESLGLNLIPGVISKIEGNLRVPHIGWNSVNFHHSHPVIETIKPDRDFYFVHSYFFQPEDEDCILGSTDYGKPFCSIVANKNIIGMQFHPEKSQRNGLALLEAFMEWDGVWSSGDTNL